MLFTNSMPAKLIATILFFHKNMLTLVFLLSYFVNNFLFIPCTLIGLISHAIRKYSCWSQHISVLTTCTFMFFDKFAPLNLQLFKTTSRMHRCSFEGRHI